MNELETYKSIVNDVRRYHRKYLKLSEEAARIVRGGYSLSLAKEFASLKVDTSWISQVQATIPKLSIALDSPAVKLARLANISISRMLGTTKLPDDFTKQMVSVSESWKQQIKQIQSLADSISAAEATLRSHLAGISKLTILAQGSLSVVPYGEIGKALKVAEGLRGSLSKSFLDFTQSYFRLFQSFEKANLDILSSPPKISALPSIEFFSASNLISVITVKDIETELSEERQEVLDEINGEIERTLPTLLAELDKGLVQMWKGARTALDSSNPDHVRHFATSLRELFTHVLHRLAPDEMVRQWSANPEHFSDNRPTRRARLLFICRDINYGPFIDFLKKDIAAVLEFTKLFQRGTHEVTAPYTEEQLVALRSRMESVLRFLIEISL